MNAGDPLWWWGVLIGGLAVGWSLDSWSLRRVKRERDLAIIEAARYKATLADLGLEGADGLVPTYRTVSVEYSSRVDRRILPVQRCFASPARPWRKQGMRRPNLRYPRVARRSVGSSRLSRLTSSGERAPPPGAARSRMIPAAWPWPPWLDSAERRSNPSPIEAATPDDGNRQFLTEPLEPPKAP